MSSDLYKQSQRTAWNCYTEIKALSDKIRALAKQGHVAAKKMWEEYPTAEDEASDDEQEDMDRIDEAADAFSDIDTSVIYDLEQYLDTIKELQYY